MPTDHPNPITIPRRDFVFAFAPKSPNRPSLSVSIPVDPTRVNLRIRCRSSAIFSFPQVQIRSATYRCAPGTVSPLGTLSSHPLSTSVVFPTARTARGGRRPSPRRTPRCSVRPVPLEAGVVSDPNSSEHLADLVRGRDRFRLRHLQAAPSVPVHRPTYCHRSRLVFVTSVEEFDVRRLVLVVPMHRPFRPRECVRSPIVSG